MSPVHYVALSVILFVIGGVGVLVRRNAIVVFMCIELMLNACNLAFVQIIVYTGAVLMLFLFVLMLIGISSALSPRDPAGEPRFVPADETLEITAESGEWEPAPSGRAES